MKPLVSVKWDDLETSSRGRNFGQCLNIIYAKVLLRGSLDRCQENYQNNVPERVEKVLSKKTEATHYPIWLGRAQTTRRKIQSGWPRKWV